MEAVLNRNFGLVAHYPGLHGFEVRLLYNANGDLTLTMGISLRVDKTIDQSTLPAEDRIPECIEGVPVQIREGPRFEPN